MCIKYIYMYIYTKHGWQKSAKLRKMQKIVCVCASMQCCKCSFLTSFPWMCPNMQPDWIC